MMRGSLNHKLAVVWQRSTESNLIKPTCPQMHRNGSWSWRIWMWTGWNTRLISLNDVALSTQFFFGVGGALEAVRQRRCKLCTENLQCSGQPWINPCWSYQRATVFICHLLWLLVLYYYYYCVSRSLTKQLCCSQIEAWIWPLSTNGVLISYTCSKLFWVSSAFQRRWSTIGLNRVRRLVDFLLLIMSVDLALLFWHWKRMLLPTSFNQRGYISLSGVVAFGVPCFMARKVRSWWGRSSTRGHDGLL